LGLVIFNNINNEADSGIKCTLSMFACSSKLSGAADTTKGRNAIERDLAEFENWAHMNLMNCSKIKHFRGLS